jgi:hypothetical protein
MSGLRDDLPYWRSRVIANIVPLQEAPPPEPRGMVDRGSPDVAHRIRLGRVLLAALAVDPNDEIDRLRAAVVAWADTVT